MRKLNHSRDTFSPFCLIVWLCTMGLFFMQHGNVQAAEENAVESQKLAEQRADFDWTIWQRLPVLDGGRIKPIDSLADELVTLVTGRSKWTDPETDVKYRAPELLYAWIADPDTWLKRKILRCEFRPLRDILNTENSPIPTEGTYISVSELMDWERSQKEGRPIFWSADFQSRIKEIDLGSRKDKQPDQVGETPEDRRINGKVGELFNHLQTFLKVKDARSLYIVPGLDPRTLTTAVNPNEKLQHWTSLGVLLDRENWLVSPDVTLAALMASDNEALLNWAVNMQGVFPFEHFPQLTLIQNFKAEVLVEVKKVDEAFSKTKTAYQAGDAGQFESSMQNFEREVRRLAEVMETKRATLDPPKPNSINFGEFDKMIWQMYKPLELNPKVLASSAYPPEGSTDWELKYNQSQPFKSAWIYFLIATIVTSLSLITKRQRLIYCGALAISFGAILYSTWGFFLRIVISGRAPVTNMYETVVWVAYVVAILGVWFCLLPFMWPGLKKSWEATQFPFSLRKRNAESSEPKIGFGPFRIISLLIQTAAFVGIVWFLTGSDTTFRIISLKPPVTGKAISIGAIGVWLTGITTVILSAWYIPRAMMTLVGGLYTVPASFKQWDDKLWKQVFDRRFFLLGALPVACLGMLLAYFVGVRSPDILNPRIGSIAAVLRNNYWLTIHVLTIVSSYGAGALAWGLGNLALFYYLLGSYKNKGDKESFSDRVQLAKEALKPSRMASAIKENVAGFGSGDEHLEKSKRRPPKEVSTLASYTYKAMQVAVLLLAAGTILGGLWADVSWGRFWDWDPKEVWALISLLVYLAVLHGRFAGWVGTLGTNIGGVLCFNAILMSWYGVNFVLPQIHGWLTGSNAPTAVGLHSYATGAGGLEYVLAAVLLNLILVLAASSRYIMETQILDTDKPKTDSASAKEEPAELENSTK